jgi:hypothetical protein
MVILTVSSASGKCDPTTSDVFSSVARNAEKDYTCAIVFHQQRQKFCDPRIIWLYILKKENFHVRGYVQLA